MPDMATTSLPRTPMIAVPDWPYGPYTVDGLDALPDEGVRRELVNGWIIVAPWPSTFHDHAAKKLERALDDAAVDAAADVYIRGPLDIDTGPSIRVPDLVVVEGECGPRGARSPGAGVRRSRRTPGRGDRLPAKRQ
jgi:hypothetical protein